MNLKEFAEMVCDLNPDEGLSPDGLWYVILFAKNALEQAKNDEDAYYVNEDKMTELSVVIDHMNNHNFGYARDVLVQIYKRLKDYDLEVKKNDD